MVTKERDERWEAVLARDNRLDGTFVYGVRSTGIFCRPSCGARKPRQDQVVFFPSPDAAIRAGYRPCRRCRPVCPGNGDPHREMAGRLCRFIEEYDSADRPLTLAVMSDYMKVSPHHLQRTFTRVVGVSPRTYMEMSRLKRLKTLIRNGLAVTDALYESGYGSSSRLYEGSDNRLGMTPGTYKKGGKGMRIHYAVVDSSLGRLLVAATDRGVSAVSLGGSDEELKEALYEEYPSADIVRDPSGLKGYVELILAYIGGKVPVLDLPRDVRVTAFQARVHEALRKIPYGTVRTYAQIADSIGSPGAARAVGNACGANPTALVVPCHRVVRGDGSVGGYRWGVDRKRALLDMERNSYREETFEKGAGI
jgi:AraC family transcriptional regulator of adaptative response/methylated-DNA-[protein]-cysteine methyltransferase